MSLWVQSGASSVFKAFPTNNSSTKVNLDDRTVTASSPQDLYQLHQEWKHWSQKVGLLESDQKAKVSATKPSLICAAKDVFPHDLVEWSVKALGSMSASCLPSLHEEENRRFLDARRVVSLLGCCNFRLDPHLRMVKQFAVPKVKYG